MISVVCPIYNEQKYIAQCSDSYTEQDFLMTIWKY